VPAILITGGAGFIGVNAAQYFHEKGWDVIVVDNLSRRGTEDNLRWLQKKAKITFHKTDLRDAAAIFSIVEQSRPDALLHLAAQVAVTTSVTDPRLDFEINALGSFNVLEAVRQKSPHTFVVNASTNKVYGKMEDIAVVERGGRYEYQDLRSGIDESRPLDFHSPYGCSKGVADQYTVDYARIYGLKTVTFRQSCIFGLRQFGVEDQGWVAWFIIAAVLGKQITIYGDGKQIRDILHVKDLIRAYEAAIERRDAVAGQIFNIGGGPQYTMSLLELLSDLQHELRKNISLEWSDWRPGDQPVYVSNIEKAKRLLDWQPEIAPIEGVTQLISWVRENENLFAWLR
jgi:CDP-paratose 2-epimerase